jgi:hypothetical protein
MITKFSKALVNGATSTIVSTVTIGQINNVELITVTDTDRAYGYDYSKEIRFFEHLQ